jgi:hypothetical protein
MIRIAASLVLASALLVLGANAQTAPEIQHKTEAKGAVPPAPVTSPLCVGTAFNATLSDALDTHRTRGGDEISAETAEDVLYERSTIFPKGTKISGHVVRVTTGGHGRAGSAIFVQFDKAVLKDGQEVILNAGIQALAVVGVAPMPSDTEKQKALEAEAHAVPVQEAGTPTASSDALVVSTIYEAPRPTARLPLGTDVSTKGEFTSDGLFTPDSKGVFGRPDVKVYTPTSEGSHGSVLVSSKKSMRLDSGTHLLLVVQPPSAADGAGTVDPDPNQ